jgi:hypothetical protein
MSPLHKHVIPGVPVIFGQPDWDKHQYENWLKRAGYSKGEVVAANYETTKAFWTHPTETTIVVYYSVDNTRVTTACWDGDPNRKRNTFPD